MFFRPVNVALSENEPMEKRLNFSDIQDLFDKALSEAIENKEHDLNAEDLEDVFRKASETIDPVSDEISEMLFQSLRESQGDAVEVWEAFIPTLNYAITICGNMH